MDSKSEQFDLKKEKQELDAFLSTLAGTDEPSDHVVKKSAPAQDRIELVETRPAPGVLSHEAPKPRPLAETPKPEDIFVGPAYHEKPKAAGVPSKPAGPLEDTEQKQTITSSFLPPLQDQKEKPSSGRLDIEPPPASKPSRVTAPLRQDVLEERPKPEPSPGEEKAAPSTLELEKDMPGPDQDAVLYQPTSAGKKPGAGKRMIVLILFVILLLGGAAWMYSGLLMNAAKSLPGVGGVIKSLSSVEKNIHLINVRQRLVENKPTGKSMRVVEGVATNVGAQAISNIRIAAKLQDASGSELVSMEAVAGNVLTDEKLENLEPGAITAALKAPKGAAGKIPPKGHVPFMIVFSSEPPGVFKMSISPVDFVKH